MWLVARCATLSRYFQATPLAVMASSSSAVAESCSWAMLVARLWPAWTTASSTRTPRDRPCVCVHCRSFCESPICDTFRKLFCLAERLPFRSRLQKPTYIQCSHLLLLFSNFRLDFRLLRCCARKFVYVNSLKDFIDIKSKFAYAIITKYGERCFKSVSLQLSIVFIDFSRFSSNLDSLNNSNFAYLPASFH